MGELSLEGLLPVFTSIHLSVLAAGGLVVLAAAPALAQTYDCNIRQRSWAGLISENYRFEIDAEKGRVNVLDPIIRFAYGKPIKGVFETVSESETRVIWQVEEVPIAPEGGPTEARFEAMIVTGETVDVDLKALWSDESDAGNGKGRCTFVE